MDYQGLLWCKTLLNYPLYCTTVSYHKTLDCVHVKSTIKQFTSSSFVPESFCFATANQLLKDPVPWYSETSATQQVWVLSEAFSRRFSV